MKNSTIVRLPKVRELTGLSRSSIYRMIQDGTFPEQILLGGRAVGWIEAEIYDWISARIQQSRSGQSSSLDYCFFDGLVQ